MAGSACERLQGEGDASCKTSAENASSQDCLPGILRPRNIASRNCIPRWRPMKTSQNCPGMPPRKTSEEKSSCQRINAAQDVYQPSKAPVAQLSIDWDAFDEFHRLSRERAPPSADGALIIHTGTKGGILLTIPIRHNNERRWCNSDGCTIPVRVSNAREVS